MVQLLSATAVRGRIWALLVASKTEAERALERYGRILAVVSHDMRGSRRASCLIATSSWTADEEGTEAPMGRKSREKRERRANGGRHPRQERWEKTLASSLQARGTELGPLLEDFAAAYELEGSAWIRKRLLADHNIRMVKCGNLPPEYLVECWRPLRDASIHYHALKLAGYEGDRHPASYHGTWPEHLQWGLDSIQQAVRLLLCGQIVGASVIARGQLERWTENRAHNFGMSRKTGESGTSFAERVWAGRSLDSLRYSGDVSDVISDGRELSPAVVMDGLNKVVHAEKHVTAVEWANQTFPGLPRDAVHAARLVADALFLASRQLARCLSQMLIDQGMLHAARNIVIGLPLARIAITPPPSALWPVNLLVLHDRNSAPVYKAAAFFDQVLDGQRPGGQLLHDGQMMLYCFLHYRARAFQSAKYAFTLEESKVGPLNDDSLTAVESPLILASEMAGMLASWLPRDSYSRNAAAILADAIRSSLWLWLEDDTRAMAALRVVLEQSARLRVWRLKPQHGPRLEAYGKPTQWLDRAGWSRLGALNKALGEMSHFRKDVHWDAAYELLVALNPEATPDEARFVARRYALEAVTRLAMREVREQVRILDEGVGTAFDMLALETMAGGPEVDGRLEAYLNHAQAYRGVAFPGPSGWQKAEARTRHNRPENR